MSRELFDVSLDSLIITLDVTTTILTLSELAVRPAYTVDGIGP